jgi:hypothetical protein
MMARIGLVVLAVSLGACTHVTSGMSSTSTTSGDAWYSKRTDFLGLPVDSAVYYCPKETPTRCTRAVMVPYNEPVASGTTPGEPVPAGAPTPQRKKQFGGACSASSDCATGLTCNDGRCARP